MLSKSIYKHPYKHHNKTFSNRIIFDCIHFWCWDSFFVSVCCCFFLEWISIFGMWKSTIIVKMCNIDVFCVRFGSYRSRTQININTHVLFTFWLSVESISKMWNFYISSDFYLMNYVPTYGSFQVKWAHTHEFFFIWIESLVILSIFGI